MNKFLSILFSVTLLLSTSVTAYAEGNQCPTERPPEDSSTVTITKDYQATNEGTTSPAENFYFSIESESVTDAADGITVDNMPVPTIGYLEYASGDAGSTNAKKQVSIELPTYSSVGIYTYLIYEFSGASTGVTYHDAPILLRVTVVQGQTGLVRIAAVHTEGPCGKKSDTFPNVYSAGKLSVTKLVTGNLGDRSKDFEVTVTFHAPNGESVNADIDYMEDTIANSIPAGWNGSKSVVLHLKHDETVTFENIPYGVTYTVTESDYTSEGYDSAVYEFTDQEQTIHSAGESVTITNNKEINVDTGIYLDNLPYFLILVLIVGAAVLYFSSKRRIHKD